MPKRTDIKSVLIIGAGPIVIGQACEFDYSGAQACKALREEGYKVILVNSNPATIMTDPQTADVTYIEPITKEVVERIIAKERPDAILPTMGGQTALNCAMELAKSGVLEKYGVQVMGTPVQAIIDTEDREKFVEKLDEIDVKTIKSEDRLKFKEAMDKIGLSSARSGIAYSLDDALKVQAKIGFPAIIRPSFTLGGSGGGVATLGIDYYELGQITGEMAYEILVNGADPATMEIAYAPNFTPKYNAANCEALGLTPPEGYEAIAAE